MSDRQTVLTRRPPVGVRRALCSEVGFRCPVEGCGSPYLTFHHFDPPWRTKHHHKPEGMIALCSNHAAKADQNYYPDDFMRQLKREGAGRAEAVRGEFDYLRRDLLVIVGSNAYYKVDTVLQVGDKRAIYFNRDDNGYLLLNFQLPGVKGKPQAWMEDNVWIVPPGAQNVDCPPRGRYLEVFFHNGDRFRIEYSEVMDAEQYKRKFSKHDAIVDQLAFPLTVAEFWERSAGAGIELGRDATRIGTNVIRDSTIVGSRVGIMIGSAVSAVSHPTGISEEGMRAIAAALAMFNRGRA